VKAVPFKIEGRALDPATHLVRVSGEIDLFAAPEFKQRVAAAIATGARTVIVDLTPTTFVDSSSLGVLIGAHRRLDDEGRALAVVCDTPAILKTFAITGLDGVFTIVRNLDEVARDAVNAR
jgi:anti-sigma B factor antagonist